MKQLIEDLYPMNRCLLGEGYDNALKYIAHLIDLDVQIFPTGTKVGNWTVPDEWVVRDAWVKYKGKKIIDYQKDPLSLLVYSKPFQGEVELEELLQHLYCSEEKEDCHSYEFKFYERDWGFTLPKKNIFTKDEAGKSKINLKKGKYEVFIDTEYKAGMMKVGVHTIKGKTDREVLLFAHLDHPFQANDNLSAVACLVDMVKKVKPEQFDHTIKLIFCPETIGSIAYGINNSLAKTDFVIALDIVGNKTEQGILMQKAVDETARINDIMHLALRGMGTGYRQGRFRSTIGSDEYYFNDPNINIPGLLLTTFPYDEYHTSADKPDIIDYQQIEKVQYAVIKAIEYYEKDYIPVKNFNGPLFRSGYGIQTKGKQLNLSWDYLIYQMDGKKTLSRLCVDFGLNFEHTYELLERVIADGVIHRRSLVG